MLRAIPVLVIFSLPFLNLFGVTDFAGFKLSPVQGALDLIDYAFGEVRTGETPWRSYVNVFLSILHTGFPVLSGLHALCRHPKLSMEISLG